jgi:four helix bundle protein
MTKEELKERFRQFSLRIINLVNNMPNNIAGNAIAKQIVRSGTSPAANYRAACLAKSDKDFLNKLKMVEEEIDETQHWLSIIMDTGMISKERVLLLYEESIELNRIIVKSIISTKSRIENDKITKL